MQAPKQQEYVIYAVLDPRTDEVHYVGQTNQPKYRSERHQRGKTHGNVAEWEQGLIAEGVKPKWVVLETVGTKAKADDLEAYWIKEGLRLGWPLVNMLAGPVGYIDGYVPLSVRSKISVSMKKRWQDPKFHDEHVRKMTEVLADPEVRRKISEAVRGRVTSDKTRELISRTMTELWADPEYAEHQREAVAQAASDLWKREGFREQHAERMRREETRAKIGEAARKMWADPEIRAKLTAERRSRGPLSEEHKRKISEGGKRRWEEYRRRKQKEQT